MVLLIRGSSHSRLKEKYEKDLLLAENVEKSLREKYAETRTKLAESDAQVRNCQAEVQQLQLELSHSKKMCGDFINERDKLRDNLHTEIQNEVAMLNERHKQEMDQLQKRYVDRSNIFQLQLFNLYSSLARFNAVFIRPYSVRKRPLRYSRETTTTCGNSASN